MLANFNDVEPAVFKNAVQHLASLGVTELAVFRDRRQQEGSWLVAYIILNGRRYVRWTGEVWEGFTLSDQAPALARQLELFNPSEDVADNFLRLEKSNSETSTFHNDCLQFANTSHIEEVRRSFQTMSPAKWFQRCARFGRGTSTELSKLEQLLGFREEAERLIGERAWFLLSS